MYTDYYALTNLQKFFIIECTIKLNSIELVLYTILNNDMAEKILRYYNHDY